MSTISVPPIGVPSIQQIDTVNNPRDAAINAQTNNSLNQVKINTLKGGGIRRSSRSSRSSRRYRRCSKCNKRILTRRRRKHIRYNGGNNAQYIVPQNHMLYNDNGLVNKQMAQLAVLGGQNAANQRYDNKV